MSDIRIDKDGKWYFRGAEMIRRDIIRYFYEHLKLDAEGRYKIEIPSDSCYVEVEDTAFVVKSVDVKDDEVILYLSDDSQEVLDPSTLMVGDNNVLYCRVKKGQFPARFSRSSYYQLTAYLDYDEGKGFYLNLAHGQFFLNAFES
ncbi:MAG: DUF1285 domain-containing protein [Syntrophales bacterium]|nr:DUF1285 domain-containing protein [Syntrophales bacterium]